MWTIDELGQLTNMLTKTPIMVDFAGIKSGNAIPGHSVKIDAFRKGERLLKNSWESAFEFHPETHTCFAMTGVQGGGKSTYFNQFYQFGSHIFPEWFSAFIRLNDRLLQKKPIIAPEISVNLKSIRGKMNHRCLTSLTTTLMIGGKSVSSTSGPTTGQNTANYLSKRDWDPITQIEFRYGECVDGLSFRTKTGEVSEHLGRKDAGVRLIDLRKESGGEDAWLVGFHGAAGEWMDKLGFIYAFKCWEDGR